MKHTKKILVAEFVVLILLSFIYFNFQKETYVVKTKALKNCTESQMYISDKGRNIYTYCLEDIKVKQGKKMVLLKDSPTSLNTILNHLTITESLDDGGTKIYRDTKGYTKNGLTIVVCNTLNGNQDVYIGTKNMKFQEDFCSYKGMEEFHAFTKTYHIYHIAESNDYNYLYLTLRQFQMEEIETVKVPRNLVEHVCVGKNYEFTFQYTIPIEDNLKSIFTNATLINVEETDKLGLEQTQQSIQ